MKLVRYITYRVAGIFCGDLIFIIFTSSFEHENEIRENGIHIDS